MKHLITVLLASVILTPTPISAQLKITQMEKLPLAPSREWNAPQFSVDGRAIYFTDTNFDGIWEFALGSKFVRQITSDPRSGYGFIPSPDGKQVAYRRTTINKRTHRKLQEIVVKNLADGRSTVKASGVDLALPTFVQSTLVYSVDKQMKQLSSVARPGEVSVIGIENTKIVLLRDGKKLLLDPFGKGSYIWPSLSPDKTRLVAYDMARGAFVCDIEGNVVARLGKRDAPVWTRDGKWLVYMNDKDDGHRILSSDLFCILPDGTQNVQLTNTAKVVELNPQCSPTEDKIVCNTLSGDILVLSYEEVLR
jgi:Tol biopolymer transport system component